MARSSASVEVPSYPCSEKAPMAFFSAVSLSNSFGRAMALSEILPITDHSVNNCLTAVNGCVLNGMMTKSPLVILASCRVLKLTSAFAANQACFPSSPRDGCQSGWFAPAKRGPSALNSLELEFVNSEGANFGFERGGWHAQLGRGAVCSGDFSITLGKRCLDASPLSQCLIDCDRTGRLWFVREPTFINREFVRFTDDE